VEFKDLFEWLYLFTKGIKELSVAHIFTYILIFVGGCVSFYVLKLIQLTLTGMATNHSKRILSYFKRKKKKPVRRRKK